jgi:hypothetical protein
VRVNWGHGRDPRRVCNLTRPAAGRLARPHCVRIHSCPLHCSAVTLLEEPIFFFSASDRSPALIVSTWIRPSNPWIFLLTSLTFLLARFGLKSSESLVWAYGAPWTTSNCTSTRLFIYCSRGAAHCGPRLKCSIYTFIAFAG